MTTLDLLNQYEQSPKKFANKYMSIAQSDKIELVESKKSIDTLLQPYYDLYGYKNFSQIFYHIKHGEVIKECKVCGCKTNFKSFKQGYKTYCSLQCSRSDGTKTSPEMIKVATNKRMKKMRELLNDKVRGKEYRDKISKKSKHYNNLHGEKEKRSILLKERIKSGNFNPNITNSWTRWDICVDDKKFRSSFEGLFHLYYNLYLCRSAEFEKLRIPYIFEENEKIYIVDFIDYEHRVVFEIKPKSLTETNKNISKMEALKNWCLENDYSYKCITEEDLKIFLDEMRNNLFDHSFMSFFLKKYKW